MDEAKRQGGLDACKLLAALLVVAIHTSPLAELAPLGDFFLTRVLGRLAVPFFFMVTGHFVLGPVLAGRAGQASSTALGRPNFPACWWRSPR